METKYIECSCHLPEHTLRFTLDDDPDWEAIFIETYLSHYFGFFKRLWYGVKYIFGYKNKYSAFDTTVLCREQIKELRELCNISLKEYENTEG